MATAYRLKYPNAASKESHYRGVASSLRGHHGTLQGHITTVKTRNPADYEDSRVKGDYYTEYVGKKDDFFTQYDQIAEKSSAKYHQKNGKLAGFYVAFS